MNWSKFNPFTEEESKNIDVSKDLSSQINNQGPVNTGMPNYGYQAPQPAFQPSQNIFSPAVPTIALTPEEQQKWQDYLTNIYNNARKEIPNYDDFENNVDALASIMPSEPQRVQAVGVIFKNKGITKKQMLDAANHVAQVINDSKTTFDNEQATRVQKGITDIQGQIQQKQQDILNLQNEIAQANMQIVENQNKLAKREYGFNSCHKQLVMKISADINAITNNVAE